MKPADEVLREVLAERADGITPDGDVYVAVLARRRRGRRRAVIGAGVAAAIVVGGAAAAVPAVRGADRSLPAVTPSPTADPLTACVPPVLPGEKPPPAPVPVSQLPRQHDVRGSLAGNLAVTDAALVAGWQGILLNEGGLAGLGAKTKGVTKHTMDRASLRLRFVERAGAGTVALATAADRTGRWQVATWVVGEGSTFRPTGGPSEQASASDLEPAQRFYGDDPVFVSAYPVCGKIFGWCWRRRTPPQRCTIRRTSTRTPDWSPARPVPCHSPTGSRSSPRPAERRGSASAVVAPCSQRGL